MPDYGRGAQGAVAGGIAGGAIGGPIGAGIGALAGGAFGLFGGGGGPRPYRPDRGAYNLPGYNNQYNYYGELATQAGHRQAPQAGVFRAGDSAYRGQQSALARMLMDQARGNGPGQQVVRMQAQNMADRAQAQAMGAATRANPQMAALAGRNAMMAGANAQSAVGQQAALGGLQAQLGATSQLGDVLQGARGQDQTLSMFNAGQRQSGSQFNADARLRQMGLNDATQAEMLRQRLAAAGMQQQGSMGYQNTRAGISTAQMGQPTAFDRTLSGAAAVAPFLLM